MLIRLSILILIFCALHQYAAAQSYRFYGREKYAITVNGMYFLNSHTSAFRSFQGSTDCAEFTSGSGNGIGGGIGIEYPLNGLFAISAGIQYTNRSADLSVITSLPYRDTKNNKLISIQTDNRLKSTLQYLEFQPDIRFTFFEIPDWMLRVLAGPRFLIPVKQEFTQSENILSPENAVFTLNGRSTQERPVAAGSITTAPTLGIGATAGIESLIRIGSNLHLTQTFCYDMALSNIAQDADWKTNSLRISLGLRYSFRTPNPSPRKAQ
jgi:hypothetical protein